MEGWKGLIGADEIKKYYRLKTDGYDRQSIDRGKEEYYLDRGWTIDRKLKTKTKIYRQKPFDRFYEDKVWASISKMGFTGMNSDREFRIPISDSGGANPFQIDVFAIDDDVAVVIECKAAEKLSYKSVRDTIASISGKKGDIIKSIRGKFDSKCKVGFVLATKNYEINDSDRDYAKQQNIALLNEYDFEYYNMLQSNIGTAAKYQFLSDVFENTEVEGLGIKVPAVRGKMGPHTFYSFAIEPARLLPISYVSHRAKNSIDETTYQRIIKKSRLNEIRTYVEEKNGMFPNSIIINFHTGKKNLRFDKSSDVDSGTKAQHGILYLPKRYKSAWIIDGQHRLYGFTGTDVAEKMTVPVVAFENLDGFTEAKMFVDINSKQVKVPKGQLVGLYSELFWESDIDSERLSALISKTITRLATDNASPLKGKIKLSERDYGPITMPSISNQMKKGGFYGTVKSNGFFEVGPFYVFDKDRSKSMNNSLRRGLRILNSYFTEFSKASNWNLESRKGGFLLTNDAIQAELILLKFLIKHIESNEGMLARDMDVEFLTDEIKRYLEPLVKFFDTVDSETLNYLKHMRGAQGQQSSANEMMKVINSKFPDFEPDILKKYKKDREAEWDKKSQDKVKAIQKMISDDVISTLKTEYGEDDDSWIFNGVPQGTREEIFKRKGKESKNTTFEEHFDLIHYKHIIVGNWQLFSEKYGDKNATGKKDNQISWFDKLNTIRNKVFHPERGPCTEAEYNYVSDIYNQLQKGEGIRMSPPPSG
jgi:DNA sulfur modification protein DndB